MEKNNWDILRKRINEQISDCRKHSGSSGNWGICIKLYYEILSEMDRIEDGKENDYIPFNGVWKTLEEIKELKKL